MPLSKRKLMWVEFVVAIILFCAGIDILYFEKWSGDYAGVGKLILGGIPFVGAHVLAGAAALLRLEGRMAWSGQVVILAFLAAIALFFMVL